MPAGLHVLHLSTGNYGDDPQHFFSPSCNRQARQALPNGWMTSVSGNQPSNTMEGSAASAGHQIYQSAPHGRHDSYYSFWIILPYSVPLVGSQEIVREQTPAPTPETCFINPSSCLE